MSDPLIGIFERPPQTDVEYIKSELNRLNDAFKYLSDRLDGQANGINAIGENMQWIVQNVQGIFQMFSSPQFMSQMTSMMTGQMTHATGPAESADATGPAAGADTAGA